MKDKYKKDIVFLASVAGYMMRKDKLDWNNVKITKMKDNILKAVLEATDYMGSLVDPKEFTRLYNNIKDGLYYCDVYTDVEYREYKKKSLKTRRKVDGESIYTLAEFAMHKVCDRCDKNKKACKLRKAMLKSEIPPFDKEYGVCEYLQGRDKE